MIVQQIKSNKKEQDPTNSTLDVVSRIDGLGVFAYAGTFDKYVGFVGRVKWNKQKLRFPQQKKN